MQIAKYIKQNSPIYSRVFFCGTKQFKNRLTILLKQKSELFPTHFSNKLNSKSKPNQNGQDSLL